MSLQDDLVASFSWIDGHANIWPWLAEADLFAAIVEGLARPFEGVRITKVVGVEARAFLLAGAVARELSAGVVPIRKRGAFFPGKHLSMTTPPIIAAARSNCSSKRGPFRDPIASSSSTIGWRSAAKRTRRSASFGRRARMSWESG